MDDTATQATTTPPASEPVVASPTVAEKHSASATKKSKNLQTIIIIALVAVIIIAAIVVTTLVLLNSNRVSKQGSPYTYDAYFLPESTDNRTKYALFNDQGNQLTEFNFESGESFVDGYALARKSDGWGIIDHTGQVAVEFGKYENISKVGGLYITFTPGESSRDLIYGSGQKITSFDTSQNTFQDSRISGDALAVVIGRGDDNYDIYDARGRHLDSVKSAKLPFVGTIYSSDHERMLTSVSYSGGIILISHQDLSVVARIKTDNEKIYRIVAATDDRSQVTFRQISKDEDVSKTPTSSSYDNDSDSDIAYRSINDKYAVYVKSVFKDLGDRCSYLTIRNMGAGSGYIECYSYGSGSTGGSGFINEKGEVQRMSTTIGQSNYGQNYHIIDASHYAISNKNSGSISFSGGNKLSNFYSMEALGDVYIINRSNGSYLYNKDGEKMCELSNKITSVQTAFNADGVAIARTNDYLRYQRFLIDRSCKILSSSYDSITAMGRYFEVSNREQNTEDDYGTYKSSYGLLDKTGNLRIKMGEYDAGFSKSYANAPWTDYIIAHKNSYKDGVVLNPDLKKIVEFKNTPSFKAEGYMTVTDDKYIRYYSLDGTEIHSVPLSQSARSRT